MSQLFASDGIFFFFSMMVYYMRVNILIVSYAININQFASANPKLPVLPPPAPHTPWQPQVCSLCLSLFLLHRYDHLCHILGSTCK